MGKEAWKIFGPVGLTSMIGGIMFGAFSMESGDALSVLSGIGLAAAVAGFAGFFTVDNKYSEEEIKAREELAKDAKEKITYLQKKANEIKAKRPVARG